MAEEDHAQTHSAEAAALGFYFQTFFALLQLMMQDTDNAAVAIEQLDDVAIKVDGHSLLFQLKHSLSATPPKVTLKSTPFWKTIRVWIDVMPNVTLSETTFNLVTVAPLAVDNPLAVLTDLVADRVALVDAMTKEAARVIDERTTAQKADKPLPHSDRIVGCQAFLGLSASERLNLMRRTVIQPGSLAIGSIEDEIAKYLKLLPPEQRGAVAKRLVQWWDREVVYSLCGKRERIISRAELQHKISLIVSEIEQDKLVPDFEVANPPEDYQPDGMLARQIKLVDGQTSDLTKAIREEWKAREQRAKWLDGSPAMASTINDYDLVLQEHWSDRHSQMAEECVDLDQAGKSKPGLNVLRWTHEQAPNIVRPISAGWDAAYYVRGSYQVLAVDLKVGWHADFATLLGEAE